MANRIKLQYKNQNAWNKLDNTSVQNYARNYIKFLNSVKTEFETVSYAIKVLEKAGFHDLKKKKNIKPGDKVFYNYENRLLLAFNIGKQAQNRFKFIISHIDSPRLDLKIRPFHEEGNLLFLKTHYYGGIKKYQWVAIPLAIHGTVINNQGEPIEVVLGEEDADFSFIIPDLLPHLGKNQLEKNAKEFISGENLKVIIGHQALKTKKSKNPILNHILSILYQKYKITEKDFIRADLRVVPAMQARSIGLDASLIAGYGQDDRICVYTSLNALVEEEASNYINSIILLDKEEIGSAGRSSANSQVIKYVIAQVLNKLGLSYTEYDLREAFLNSKALSSDVDVVFNPIYAEPFDKENTAIIGYGPILVKYTGYGGKYTSSEATADYMHEIMDILDSNKVPWQVGMLGKIDAGGGATIAKFFDNLGIKTVDFGPGILSMHSPMEISSKVDLYATFLAYKAFFKDN